MTFALLALASIVLAFGPQVVLSFDSITFSAVQQCGNFSVHFSGGKLPASLPLTLTVVPFNLTPISIEIQTSNWNSITLTGAAVTFLPFVAGTQFIASLDDANGASTGPVSDVIQVDASGDTTCLSATSSSIQQRYTVATQLTQCQDFNVTFDPTVVDAPPTVRSFVPKGQSLFLNQDIQRSSPGLALYNMAGAQGEQVVLTFSDDTGFHQATDLLVVGASPINSTSCLPNPQSPSATNKNHASPPSTTSSSSHAGLSKGGIVAIGVVCGVSVVGIAVGMVLWFCRERNRIRSRIIKRDMENRPTGGYNPSDNQTKISMYAIDSPDVMRHPSMASKPLPRAPSVTSGDNEVIHLKNPPYTKAVLDLSSPFTASTIPSPASPPLSPLVENGPRPPSIPIPMFTPKSSFSLSAIDGEAPRDTVTLTTRNGKAARTPSLSTDDIENILDMATLYSDPATPGTMQSSVLQRGSAGPLPSWRVSQDVNNVRTSPVSPSGGSQRRSPAPATPGLLTPLTARGPPNAQLPSSPLASPMTPGFLRPSLDDASRRASDSIAGQWEFVTPRS